MRGNLIIFLLEFFFRIGSPFLSVFELGQGRLQDCLRRSEICITIRLLVGPQSVVAARRSRLRAQARRSRVCREWVGQHAGGCWGECAYPGPSAASAVSPGLRPSRGACPPSEARRNGRLRHGLVGDPTCATQ